MNHLSVMHQLHDFFYSVLASFPWSAIMVTNGCSSSSLARGRLLRSLERKKNSLQYGESNIYTRNVPSDLKMPKLHQTVVIVGHRYEGLTVLKMFSQLLWLEQVKAIGKGWEKLFTSKVKKKKQVVTKRSVSDFKNSYAP